MKRTVERLAIGVVATLLAGCQETSPTGMGTEAGLFASASKKKLDVDVCAPNGGFTPDITHPWWPMDVGNQWHYEGEEDGEAVRLRITVLDGTRTIDGVTTRIVEEREWEGEGADELLLEVSWNFFAQAADGTLCYYGEDVDIFEYDEDGDLEEIVHEGAWCADDPGNAPGIFLPADPRPGMRFPMEIAPGIAEDEGRIVGGGPVEVLGELVAETLRLREFNPVDGDKGYKIFALGMGLVIDGPLVLVDIVEDALPLDPGEPIPTDQTCGTV